MRDEKFLTKEEASVALSEKGIPASPRTLADHASCGKVPGHKVNGRRRFLLSELLAHYRPGPGHEGADAR